jgi:hypothetical protein
MAFTQTHSQAGRDDMNWQQAREAFEKNFVIPELTNIY